VITKDKPLSPGVAVRCFMLLRTIKTGRLNSEDPMQRNVEHYGMLDLLASVQI